ncbi:MAG: hypothetical protein CMB80_25165 [Flammeovirgaceae bacterium]|nr:hypothetical protein [Flammeovirgaceae bacterium]MBE62783.1 hypothetical protein [Flammeovirgaceae bacterium]
MTNNESYKLDLIDIVNSVLKNWKILLVLTGFSLAIGFMIIYSTEESYSSKCVLISESGEGSSDLGGLGGLASLAGIDLSKGANIGSINPALYSSIAGSTPFLKAVAHQKYYFEIVGDTLSIYEYYINETDINEKVVSDTTFSYLPDIQRMSNAELATIAYLRERIFVNMDWKLGIVEIEVVMPDPLVSAQIANFTSIYITDYVKNYSQEKGRIQLAFVDEQIRERKIEFDRIQRVLNQFKDGNLNINSSRYRAKEQELSSEYNLIYDVYNELLKQKESLRIQLNKEIPVFSILEPVSIPNRPIKPNKKLILLLSVFTGICIGIVVVLFKVKIS